MKIKARNFEFPQDLILKNETAASTMADQRNNAVQSSENYSKRIYELMLPIVLIQH